MPPSEDSPGHQATPPPRPSPTRPGRPAPASPQGQAPPPSPSKPRRTDLYTFITPQPEGRSQGQRSQGASGDRAPSPHAPRGKGRGCGWDGPRGALLRALLLPSHSAGLWTPPAKRAAKRRTQLIGAASGSAPGLIAPGRAGLRGCARPPGPAPHLPRSAPPRGAPRPPPSTPRRQPMAARSLRGRAALWQRPRLSGARRVG